MLAESQIAAHLRARFGARRASMQDIGAVMGLCLSFFRVSGYADRMSVDQEALRQSLIDLAQNHILLVAGNPPVAVLGALVGPLFFNPAELQATELFWWCEPKHRGIGRDLLTVFEREAKEKGAKRACMLCLEHLDPERVGEIYERNGYELVEHGYMKEL